MSNVDINVEGRTDGKADAYIAPSYKSHPVQAGAIKTIKPCMKHLPDLLTLRHRCPLFLSSVRPSVNSSVMSKLDIYVKVSILINYKTKQQSNLA